MKDLMRTWDYLSKNLISTFDGSLVLNGFRKAGDRDLKIIYCGTGLSIRTLHGYELVFLEIKPPRMEKDAVLFLEDYWKLVNFYKDAIDFHMGLDLGLSGMAAIQVFGMLLAFMFVGLRLRQIVLSS